MGFDENTLSRFWSKVDKSGGPDACWQFMGGPHGRHSHLYGIFYTSNKGRYGAHRFALMVHTGIIPKNRGMMALHSCDNKRCCNPQHLRWGTNSENIAEAMQRNKPFYEKTKSNLYANQKARARPTKVISYQELEEIIKLVEGGLSVPRIARQIGCSHAAIYRRIKGYRDRGNKHHAEALAQEKGASDV